MKARIASDVGGTFTDSIAYDPKSGRIAVSKVPTTPQARDKGTVDGLRAALRELGLGGGDVAYVGNGMTTTATNAVIQRSGAVTAFVTNEGFRDLLLIGRQDRPSLYDIDVVRVPPLVPRELSYGIPGRLDPAGREIAPLGEARLIEAAADMRSRGVEAVMPTPRTSAPPRPFWSGISRAWRSRSPATCCASSASWSAPAPRCSTRSSPL